MNNKRLQNIQQGNLSYADIQNLPAGNSDIPAAQMPSDNQMGQAGPYDVKSIAQRDLMTIQNLVESGQLDYAQGQYLVNYVLNKAYNMVQNRNVLPVQQDSPRTTNGVAEFESENADFFKPSGRSDVLEYLKNVNVNFDKDEISLISRLIEKLENSAVDRYLKQMAREKTLNDENEIAKKRLRANAQNSNFDDNKNRVFTREQIGKMSGAEFARNEKAIMEQLKKGLIR